MNDSNPPKPPTTCEHVTANVGDAPRADEEQSSLDRWADDGGRAPDDSVRGCAPDPFEVLWSAARGWLPRAIRKRLHRVSLHRAERLAVRAHQGEIRNVNFVRGKLLADTDSATVGMEDEVDRRARIQHRAGVLPLDVDNFEARVRAIVWDVVRRDANRSAATVFMSPSEMETPSSGPSVEDIVSRRERASKGYNAIGFLPPAERTAIRFVADAATHGLDVTDEDGAAALGIAPATFRKRLERARLRMREIVDGEVAPKPAGDDGDDGDDGGRE